MVNIVLTFSIFFATQAMSASSQTDDGGDARIPGCLLGWLNDTCNGNPTYINRDDPMLMGVDICTNYGLFTEKIAVPESGIVPLAAGACGAKIHSFPIVCDDFCADIGYTGPSGCSTTQKTCSGTQFDIPKCNCSIPGDDIVEKISITGGEVCRNECLEIEVSAVDSAGVPVPAPRQLEIIVDAIGHHGYFVEEKNADGTCGPETIEFVDIPRLETEKKLYYYYDTAGTYTISGTYRGLPVETAEVEVLPDNDPACTPSPTPDP